MGDVTKNQHYVPQWYLKLFMCDGVKSSGEVYASWLNAMKMPKDICYELFLYELSGVEINTMEHELCDIENKESVKIRKFIRRLDKISDVRQFTLSDSERVMLYKFMMTMAYRQPGNLPDGRFGEVYLPDECRNFIRNLDGLPDYVCDYLVSLISDNQVIHALREHQFGCKRDGVYTANDIKDIAFIIYRATDNIKFVTSDCPFRFQDDGMFAVMPLSKNYMIAVTTKSVYKRYFGMACMVQCSDENVVYLQQKLYSRDDKIIADSEQTYDLLFGVNSDV